MSKGRDTQHLSFKQKLFLIPSLYLLRLWFKSLRLRGTVRLKKFLHEKSSPKIFIFWHNRLFPITRLYEMCHRIHPIYGLISPSKDGAWLSATYEQLGIPSVRGSSRRGGPSALRDCVHLIHDGASIAITPDGPRGPRYIIKEGTLWLSEMTHTAIAIIGIHFHHAIRLRTWDKFYLPLPFSRVSMDMKILTDKELHSSSFTSPQRFLQKALFDINKPQHFQLLERNGQLRPLSSSSL
jgi:lysophospholipid acyltransferase (LPLAT)-like uncharacterized protein